MKDVIISVESALLCGEIASPSGVLRNNNLNFLLPKKLGFFVDENLF